MSVPTGVFVDAAHAAIQSASENAGKVGWKTSEFWFGVFAAAAAVVAPAVIPGVGGFVTAAALPVAAAVYAKSRGDVKAAALAAGQAAAQAALQAGMAAAASSVATSVKAHQAATIGGVK